MCDAVLTLDPETRMVGRSSASSVSTRAGTNPPATRWRRRWHCAPEIAGNHVNLATALQRLGKPEQAIRSLEQAIALQDDLPEAHYNLGNALMETGRPAEAEAAFERATTLRPDYAEALNNLGHSSSRRGDAQAAVDYFRRARDAAPGYAPAWSNLMRCAAGSRPNGRGHRSRAAGRAAVSGQREGALQSRQCLCRPRRSRPKPRPAIAGPCRSIPLTPTHSSI